MLSRQKGIISQWDAYFIRYSSLIGWDWRLLAAQCYQESAFDPKAVSWAGAQGLMQLMPATAARMGISLAQVFEPERNIEGGARYLRHLSEIFDDIPNRQERLNFVLAAYNGGPGHVRDAMALAAKHGKNPKRWADVDYYILHQANARIIEATAKKLGIERSRFPMNIMNYGNASSASIPMLLTEMKNDGRLKPGMKLVIASFGAGLTWDANYIVY
jgi:membrane-bound lytic murein transglycosylase F